MNPGELGVLAEHVEYRLLLLGVLRHQLGDGDHGIVLTDSIGVRGALSAGSVPQVDRENAGDYPLSAPAVRPASSRRWKRI